MMLDTRESDINFTPAQKNLESLSVNYGQFVQELHRRAAIERRPLNGTFELTGRCNLNCGMCYICQSSNNSSRRSKELSASAWLKLASDAVESGMSFLLLTGGEIFLRPDLFDLYTPLTRLGLSLTLFTNGTLITDTIAKRLAEAPPSRTEITLYGATAHTYEAITGVSNSYDRCCSGIEALVKQRIPLMLKSTLTRQNVAEFDAMRQMANNWGLPFKASWLLSDRREGASSNISDFRMPADECVALEATDDASATTWTESVLRGSSLENNDNFYCTAGKASFVINPSGEMNPCIDLQLLSIRPLDLGFSAAWKELQNFVDNAPAPSKVCSECDVRHYCHRCPAWSMKETGTLTDPVPYLCEIANSRKYQYLTSKIKNKSSAV